MQKQWIEQREAVDRNAKATDRTVKAEDNMLYRSTIALD